MAYLTTQELSTHMYTEELAAIVRNDETVSQAAIDIAIEFAKSALMERYDVDKIFTAAGDARNPLLLNIIKNIAAWEIIKLCNPSIDYNDIKFRYEESRSWLNSVYKGRPTTLPLKAYAVKPSGKSFTYHSNAPRQNYH